MHPILTASFENSSLKLVLTDGYCSIFQSLVHPKLIKGTKSGFENPAVFKNRKEELKCTTERSNPAANFSWKYQNIKIGCKEPSDCQPSGIWIRISSSFVGKVEQRSLNTSVLIVPSHIDRKFFKCTATNPADHGKKDSKVYAFIRRGQSILQCSFDGKFKTFRT